jgi:protein SCO1/2
MASETLQTEQQFASLVDELAADSSRRDELIALLREGHPLYDGRGANTIVRMRGWALLALARAGLTDDSLVFLVEELDTGVDAYLVAAAARSLRSYSSPQASFAPFVMRAIEHIRYRDEVVSLERYGEYAIGSSGTSAVRELLKTLAWLGPSARGVRTEVELLKAEPGGLGKKLHAEIDRVLEAIRTTEKDGEQDCCSLPAAVKHVFSWAANARRSSETIELTVFQDHDGASITFREFFYRRPSIVVFFYTRCDNPLKCSLTITKLARIQKLLSERGLGDRIQTAAITYDPAFDLPERMQRYGERRGLSFEDGHRMLRAVDGIEVIRKHFKLGVNFIESLVNRHRIEVYILDDCGRVAASFERLHWDEQEVVQRAVDMLREVNDKTNPGPALPKRAKVAPVFGTLASVALAAFPKCPLCWAGYMSFFGIAGLEGVPYSPWLQPLLAAVIAINVGSVWLRARATGRMASFFLVSAGALMIVLSKASGFRQAALLGVLLTLAGSFLSTFTTRNQNKVKV